MEFIPTEVDERFKAIANQMDGTSVQNLLKAHPLKIQNIILGEIYDLMRHRCFSS
jgi:hypothetical protein